MFDCVPVTSEMTTLHNSYACSSTAHNQCWLCVPCLVCTSNFMGTETVARPAVEVMRNDQRQLQMADNGLTFPVTGTTWTVGECMCEGS